MTPTFEELTKYAEHLGASGARRIDASDIILEERLAQMCREPGCPNYGFSASCPPYVSGPAAFRERLEVSEHALVIILEVPTLVMRSEERREVFQLLHEIVSGVEHRAIQMGFDGARGFAGGSCKELFCESETSCLVLSGGDCRHPEVARQSMSGYGVNVKELVASAGWTLHPITSDTSPETQPTSLVVGLVLTS